MYSYILYGNIIDSDMVFPQLIKAIDSENVLPDIFICSGIIPDDIKEREKEYKYCFDKRRSWLVNSTTWLLVEDGKRIIYELRPNGNINDLRTYILGYGMSMLYLQREEPALHCAAVSMGEKALLIAGESGSGKSTVTDALLAAGYSLMADDMAVVRINHLGETMAAPGFPYQKLCRDVVTERGYCLEDLLYINEKKDKFLVPFNGKFCVKEKSLKAMIFLVKEDSADRLLIGEFRGINKFHACVNSLFLRRLLKEQSYEAWVGKKCLEMASRIPIYWIRRPLGINTLNEILEFTTSIID